MMPGIRAEKDLVSELNAIADGLGISRSEAVRRALQLYVAATPDDQRGESPMAELVRRLVDERLAQAGVLINGSEAA